MGGSVALWREFFSPQSHVFGIDINPLVPVFTQEPNIKVLVMDSRDSTLVDQIFSLRKFDIIIDDGNHTEEAIFLTFKSLWQHTEPTGVYVLEDVDARPLRVIALMQSNGWEHCWIQDTVNAAHKMEYLVIGYPPLSLAPRIGECMVPYWNETSTL
ncbi:hypothetical protein Pelo_3954 [Pelomyxa schiedti]|nr:hypothetical protein Pelo_3954 [Pelomyxa schiedti]